ncbi:leucine-rich repeat-containing protein 40-like [Physella acuta]|uniref:leucine-rich repeat-containing protein 40-like n=1 Tax=Physella acuta TaxID=109671 RepID=UPI0027DDCC7E|nr:leucine-rich repeat-containing protein 40-like [Physella acuta]
MSSFKKGRQLAGRGNEHANLTDQSNLLTDSIHPSILKQARKSGVLNLSQRGLSKVPESVWNIQEFIPEESKSVSLDNTDEKWWESVDLTKLILASNRLSSLEDGIANLTALTVLDLHDNALTSLPKAIKVLENLQKLNISRNQLKEIPSEVGCLLNLTTLQLENNQLTTLCEDICNLKSLDFLDLSHNEIKSLPDYMCMLSQLRDLNISNNRLTHLPPGIGALTALRRFDATHNQLVNLPEEFGNLLHLEQLHIRHNQLQYLPCLRHCTNLKEILAGNNNIRGLTEDHLQHLSALTCLDLRDNKIAKIPEKITLLKKLERLDLTNNDISVLPFEMGTMTNLKAIILEGNPMRSVRRDIIMRGTMELKKYLLSRMTDEESDKSQCSEVSSTNVGLPGAEKEMIRPHDLHQMKSLDYSQKKVPSIPDEVMVAAVEAGIRVINLSKNLFTDVPQNLSLLSSTLTELNLGTNKLVQVSPVIAGLHKLQFLDLRNNQLSSLPSELSTLSHLRELVLSNNRFQELPPVVFQLSNLEILFANDNKISQLDHAGFSQLTKLSTLDLQNNDITQVPPQLGNCTWLKSVLLTGNPLRNPRSAILAKGTNALLEYLRSRIQEN